MMWRPGLTWCNETLQAFLLQSSNTISYTVMSLVLLLLDERERQWGLYKVLPSARE